MLTTFTIEFLHLVHFLLYQSYIFFSLSVREVIGYDPDVLLSKETTIKDFLHPADVHKVHSSRQRGENVTWLHMYMRRWLLTQVFIPYTYIHAHAHAHVVLRTGHGIGPRVRFLSGSGEWIWIQAEVHLRHKSETTAPQYWEIKIRALRCVCTIYICTCTAHIISHSTMHIQ